jgi:glutamine synthetase
MSSSRPPCRATARCPRMTARRAEAYLKSTGIADKAFFGPENEFFIFDDVRYGSDHQQRLSLRWTRPKVRGTQPQGERGRQHRPSPGIKGGYFPVPPVDSLHDIRSAMCLVARSRWASSVEVHHHEVATAGQCEIGVQFGQPRPEGRRGADPQVCPAERCAHAYGKTVTFMPKPLVGDNGSGMHVHQSLAKNGKNLFTGDALWRSFGDWRCTTSAASSSTHGRMNA